MTGVPNIASDLNAFPALIRMCPTKEVVVVLPLDPVMPITGPRRYGGGQFHFADHFHARARARSRGARSAGTPGESTIRSHGFGEEIVRLQTEILHVVRLQIRGRYVVSARAQKLRRGPPRFFHPTTSTFIAAFHPTSE